MLWRASPNGWFDLYGQRVQAALGRGGSLPEHLKREGDGATPLGQYNLRMVMYRVDRIKTPETALVARALRPDDGWCDEPKDPAYNRLVRRPYPTSCETLFREDGLYDLILVLGHNDSPPKPGLGSAIFLHCKRGNYEPTEGCVALDPDHVRSLLEMAKPGDQLVIA